MASPSLNADDGGEGMGLDEHQSLHAGTSSLPVLTKDETMETDINDINDDSDEDQDDQSSPSLYLRRFWRKVTSEKPSFACHRNPKTHAYACTLTLSLPPSEPRVFRSPPVYASKRAAVNALAEYAMNCGVLQEASKSMAYVDTVVNPYSLPGPARGPFDNSSNPKLALSHNLTTPQNPVTLLNLAVQKHCVEAPNVVLDFVNRTLPPDEADIRGHVHKCDLRVRITPDIHETYATNAAFPSTRLAKDAVAQLALEEGVVILFKLHNSMTTKLCQRLGLSIPTNIEDHDTEEEENTAGMLSQLVQQVTRNSSAMSTTYSRLYSDTGDLYGAKISIDLGQGEPKEYEMPPVFGNKKEAKECVCRLAVRAGARADLEAFAQKITNGKLAGGSHLVHLPEDMPDSRTVDPISSLNLTMQSIYGTTEGLSYTFSEETSTLGSLGPRFSCHLSVKISSTAIRRIDTDPVFSSKKLAKEAAAKMALESGIEEQALEGRKTLEIAKAPMFSLATGARASTKNSNGVSIITSAIPTRSELLNLEGAYSASQNPRFCALPPLISPDTELDQLPPPPYLETSTSSLMKPRRVAVDANKTHQGSGTGTSLSQKDQIHASQPHMYMLQKELARVFGSNAENRVVFRISQDQDSSLYGGSVQVQTSTDSVTFSCHYAHNTVSLANEALAKAAIDSGFLSQLAKEPSANFSIEGPVDDPAKNAKTGEPAQYHPVSYVHQMCQILLGSGSEKRPVFVVFKPQGSSHFAARLTIPVSPPRHFESSAQYSSKAAAKEAVARLAIEEGLLELLQDSSKANAGLKNSGLATDQSLPPDGVLASSSVGTTAVNEPYSESEEVKPKVRRPYLLQLRGMLEHLRSAPSLSSNFLTSDYCKASGRTDPIFPENVPLTTDMDACPSRVAVKIDQEIYEMEGSRIEPDKIRERLARKILKHLVAKDAGVLPQ